LLTHPILKAMAQSRNVTAAQVAIAWLLHQDHVIVIPKSSRIEHVEQNRAALDLQLSGDELNRLNAAFSSPTQPTPLEML